MRQVRWILAACFCFSVSGSVWAQGPAPAKPRAASIATEHVPDGATTEGWLSPAVGRQATPQEAVRRKAELRAAQRQQRLESQRWFGVTNLRPSASPVPFYGSYSPTWAGSAADPHLWYGSGSTYVTYHTSVRVTQPRSE